MDATVEARPGFEAGFECWSEAVRRMDVLLPAAGSEWLAVDAGPDGPRLVADAVAGSAWLTLATGVGRGRLFVQRGAIRDALVRAGDEIEGLLRDTPAVLEGGAADDTLLLTVAGRTYEVTGRVGRGDEDIPQIAGDLVARVAHPLFVPQVIEVLREADRRRKEAVSLAAGDGSLVLGLGEGARWSCVPVPARTTNGPLGRDGAVLAANELWGFVEELPEAPVEVLWEKEPERSAVVTFSCGSITLALKALALRRTAIGIDLPQYLGGVERLLLDAMHLVIAVESEWHTLRWGQRFGCVATITALANGTARLAVAGRDPLLRGEPRELRLGEPAPASLVDVPLAFYLGELLEALQGVRKDRASSGRSVALHVSGAGNPTIVTPGGCAAEDTTVPRELLPRLPLEARQ